MISSAFTERTSFLLTPWLRKSWFWSKSRFAKLPTAGNAVSTLPSGFPWTVV